jgi:hypothetical protein
MVPRLLYARALNDWKQQQAAARIGDKFDGFPHGPKYSQDHYNALLETY